MAITIPIISEFNDKGTKQAQGALSGLSKSAKVAGAAAAAGFAAIAAGLTMAVKAAAEDQASFQQLAVTLKNVTGASDQLTQAVDKQVGKMAMASGIADDKLRPALSNLVRATGDLRLSQGALGSVMDLSVAKQIDMESASAAVGKALAGNTTALVKMLPGLKGVIDNGSSATEILQALNDQVGGASAAQADTFAGKIARMKIVFGELVETVGSWLLPLLTNLADFILQKVVPAFGYISDTIGPKVESVFGKIASVVQDYLVPAMEWWQGFISTKVLPVVGQLVSVIGNNLSRVFDVVRDKIDSNRESFAKIRDNVEAMWVVFRDKALPILVKVADVMGAISSKVLGGFIDGFIKAAAVLSSVFATMARLSGKLAEFIVKGVNVAIDAINMLIRGWNAIPDWAKPGGDISLIPSVSLPSFGGTSSGGMGQWGENRGDMPTAPSLGGIGGMINGATGGSSGGTSARAAAPAPAPASLPAPYYDTGIDPFLDNPFVRRREGGNLTVNINGGLATSADIGQAVVDAIKQYTNVSGPADIAVA